MSQLLTIILNHAVQGVCVKHARLDSQTSNDLFFILVQPNHLRYWDRFKVKYPNCTRLAQKRGAVIFDRYCPEFRSPYVLIDWLSEVLSLTDGARKLLLLDVGFMNSLGL